MLHMHFTMGYFRKVLHTVIPKVISKCPSFPTAISILPPKINILCCPVFYLPWNASFKCFMQKERQVPVSMITGKCCKFSLKFSAPSLFSMFFHSTEKELWLCACRNASLTDNTCLFIIYKLELGQNSLKQENYSTYHITIIFLCQNVLAFFFSSKMLAAKGSCVERSMVGHNPIWSLSSTSI